MFGLTKKQQREMLADQFFYFLDLAGEAFHAVISEATSAPGITLEEVVALAEKHGADERVVLAFYGYLPDDEGTLLNVNHHSNAFKRVHIEGPEHLAAWTLHTCMMWERKGNWSPYTRSGPNAG
jgi:hypothetical protein